VKPSELTPFTATALATLALEAGVPKGVFNVVTGEPTPIGSALCESPVVRKLSFTGSTGVGKFLYQRCSDTVKKLALELGGNAPAIVCSDADLDAFLDGMMFSKFRNAGQACIATNRVYIAASIHDRFVEALVQRVKKDLRLGHGGSPRLDGTDSTVTMGPLITATAAKKIAGFVEGAVKQGATLTLGGRHPAGLPPTFYEPTILTNVTSTMDIANCEVFGPVISIIKYDDNDLEKVVHEANNVPAGLAAYVFTSDYKKQWRLSEALQYGMVGVNEGAISSPACPFGGVKQSGLGRDGSKYGIDQFLNVKYVLMGGKI
jgi:succinate-semialdehyde dehydrogenase/glutarate-semialdehyde dehydrogenase